MIDEYVSAVTRFTDDLWAVGIPLFDLDKVEELYCTALFEPSEQGWARLYRHVSQLLQQWLRGRPEPSAARRVLAFIDDDFSRAVLERPMRARLRDLLQHRIA